MRRAIGIRRALCAVALAVPAFAALPASATTGYYYLNGNGTITPGFDTSTVFIYRTFTYSGSGFAVTDSFQGTISCTLSGTDYGNAEQGTGSYTGTCTTLFGTEPVSGSYTRSGTETRDAGFIGPGPVSGSLIGGCTWVPTSVPERSYDESCQFIVI